MRVSAFDFHLPEESIALRPAKPRDSAKLLQVSGQGDFTDHIVKDLPSLLREGDVLVLNETKVLRAALTATRTCLLYTSPSPRDLSTSRMPSSA